MKNIIYKISILCMVAVLAVSCKDDTPDGFIQYEGDTGELLRDELGGVNLYYDALVKTGLDSRLTGDTEYTYFVPNNAAMQVALESGGFKTVAAADVDFLTTLINNHTVTGKALAQDLSKTSITSVGNTQLYISVGSEVVINAKSAVSNADNETDNGVVHVISFPILDFPTVDIPTFIADLAAQDSLFTTLNAALVATGLDAALDDTLYTLFAPTDAAFAALGLDATNIATALTNEALTDILLQHVFAGRNFTIDLSDGRLYSLAGDASDTVRGFDFDVSSSSVSIEIGAEASSDDDVINVLTTNGTIHIMDAVLQPQPYVVDAFSNGGFNPAGGNIGLVAGFQASLIANLDVDSIFRTETEYTILAPRGWSDPGTADSIETGLLNHVFEGSLSLAGSVGSAIESVNGSRYFVTTAASGAIILNGAHTITRYGSGTPVLLDEETYNGNITMLNSVLNPLPEVSTATLFNARMDSSDYGLFATALEFFELDSLPNVTYLYLTNAEMADVYFDAIGAADNDINTAVIAGNDYDSLASLIDVADAATLTSALNDHILTEVFFGSDLDAGNSYTDRNGGTIEIVQVNTSDGTTQSTGLGILVIPTSGANAGVVSIIPFTEANSAIGSNGVVHILESIRP